MSECANKCCRGDCGGKTDAKRFLIAPSLLAADFSRLGEDVARIEALGAEYLHLDVMDGIFVPNLSFGPDVIAALRKQSRMFFDTHLMITDPMRYLDVFAKCGSDGITVHYESCFDPAAAIEKIKSLGLRAAVSIKPATKASAIKHLLPMLDMVLVMSVEPGFGGQKFMPSSLEAVGNLVQMRDELGLDFDIEIDGGIGRANIESVLAAGVNIVVAGSSIFKADDPAAEIAAFRKAAAEAGLK